MASPFRPKKIPRRRRSPFHDAAVDYVHNLVAGSDLRPDELHLRLSSERLVMEAIHAPGVQKLKNAAPRGPRNSFVDRVRRFQRRAASKPLRQPRPPQAAVNANLHLIGSLFDLVPAELATLQFVLATREHRELHNFGDYYDDLHFEMAIDLVAVATGLTTEQVRQALGPRGRLIRAGLIEVELQASHALPHTFTLKRGLLEAILTPGLDRQTLMTRYLAAAGQSTLEWSDFSHMEGRVRTLRDVIAGALRTRTPGINILLYGPTGTGKTELARLLAKDIGCELYACGESDDDGGSAEPSERLSSLMLGQSLVGSAPALLLFDELEDLFGPEIWSDRQKFHLSKQWFNLLLERNATPIIWISNSTFGMDVAFLRRFAYAIEFHPLGIEQRTRILARHLDGDSRLSPIDIRSVARRFPSSAAVLASTCRTARLIAPDAAPERAHIESILEPIHRLITGRDPLREPTIDITTYGLDILNTSEDVSNVARRLESTCSGDDHSVSLCLYGPPGSGKSAFVYHLAKCLNKTVLAKRASDILNAYLGESEKAIAQAFREAHEDDAILLFDEVDSFLLDRRRASLSWELTLVNEFLEQLESFHGVVACTTNLSHELDEASRRRFTFNIEFRHLRPTQSVKLFERMFSGLLASRWNGDALRSVSTALQSVHNLTPVDFALVARRMRATAETWDVTQIVMALLEESRAKRGKRRRLGFVTGSLAD